MTRPRVLFVLLLALLLPLRGAVAAGWPCVMGGEGRAGTVALAASTSAATATEEPPCHAAMAAMATMASSHEAPADDASADGKGDLAPKPAGSGDCPLCAAVCSAASLPSAAVLVMPPLLMVTAAPATASRAVVANPLDRLERPPRNV